MYKLLNISIFKASKSIETEESIAAYFNRPISSCLKMNIYRINYISFVCYLTMLLVSRLYIYIYIASDDRMTDE
jgi:hypothetical protein